MSNIDKHLSKYSDKQIKMACDLIEDKMMFDEYIEIDADEDRLTFLIIAKAVGEFKQNRILGADLK